MEQVLYAAYLQGNESITNAPNTLPRPLAPSVAALARRLREPAGVTQVPTQRHPHPSKPLRQFPHMRHNIRVPWNHLFQPLTGKLRAQSTKLRLMLPGAGMNPAPAALRPLRHIAVRLHAARAYALQLFGAARAAAAAGRDLFRLHSYHPGTIIYLFTKESKAALRPPCLSGDEGSRTPVRKLLNGTFSERSQRFNIPSAARPLTG